LDASTPSGLLAHYYQEGEIQDLADFLGDAEEKLSPAPSPMR